MDVAYEVTKMVLYLHLGTLAHCGR